MAFLLLLYTLVVLALVGIAIYEHITISTLSLPISPTVTFLTILLPLLSPVTTLTMPYLFPNNPSPNRTHPRNRKPLFNTPILPLLSHLLQLTLTTTLLTLFTSTLTSPTTTSCLLSNRWRALWTSHNAPAIRTVQDALSCCGFRSTRDMAWPFPRGENPDTGMCERQFGRYGTPCLPRLEEALRRAVGGEVGVVVCVGVVQVFVVIFSMRHRGRDGEREVGWMRGFVERLFSVGGGREREGVEGSRRPLLAAAEEEEGGDVAERGYREVVDEEDGLVPRDDHDQVEQGRGNGGYGAVGDEGPRVEPAHHDPWAGVQRS